MASSEVEEPVEAVSDAPALTIERALGILAQLVPAEAHPVQQAARVSMPAALAQQASAGPVEQRTDFAEVRYRTLIEQIPAVTFLASLAGDANEVYVSPQIEALLGFTQEEWVSDPVLWYRQTHPDDRERVSFAFAESCATGRPFRDDIRVLTRAGEVVWVHAEARLVRDPGGQPVFLQGVAFDVTDAYRAADARDELVAERAQREEVERERERKEQFLAAAAHDLRTPLTAMTGLVQLMQRRASRGQLGSVEELLPALRQIDKSAKRMRHLLDQLMDVSRLKMAQPLALNKQRLGLRRLVAEAVEDHQAISERHQLVLEGPEEELWGVWDAARIDRVLSNLLTNAIKYSPAGGRVTVRLNTEEQPEGVWALVEVQDQGVGIPKRDLPHIFERFRRGANVAYTSGTGIGLAYVYEVVQEHGGRIVVHSREGEGSTFKICLPVTLDAGG